MTAVPTISESEIPGLKLLHNLFQLLKRCLKPWGFLLIGRFYLVRHLTILTGVRDRTCATAIGR